MQAATSPSAPLALTKPRRLSTSSQHRRRAIDLHRYTGKTPSLIATVSSSRAAVAPSPANPAAAKLRESADADADDDEDQDNDDDAADDDDHDPNRFRNPDLYGGSGGVSGRRKGVIFKCETCSKVYRHPSCLIKHRWEHSPHWESSSKIPLSKHQQVQLLEGAAILSHLTDGAVGGTSLPEDRAVWPSWTSGGTLPMPTGTKDPAALKYQAEHPHEEVYAEVFEEEHPRKQDDEDEPMTGSSNSTRRSLRPRSRSAGTMLTSPRLMTRAALLSGGVSKSIPSASALRKKTGPVKAGFTPPAHARVQEVAPGVLVVPSASESASPPPMPSAISIPAMGSMTSSASGLDVLASLSLSASSPLAASFPPAASLPFASFGSFAQSSYGGGFSSSLPQSSVRSSSGDSDDASLPEEDESMTDDEMDVEITGGAVTKREQEWDGMDFQMDM